MKISRRRIEFIRELYEGSGHLHVPDLLKAIDERDQMLRDMRDCYGSAHRIGCICAGCKAIDAINGDL